MTLSTSAALLANEGHNSNVMNALPFLEGISGIGLVILDYLADYDSNWDECLMIN